MVPISAYNFRNTGKKVEKRHRETRIKQIKLQSERQGEGKKKEKKKGNVTRETCKKGLPLNIEIQHGYLRFRQGGAWGGVQAGGVLQLKYLTQ
jgi:hypothetical protein